MGSYFSSMWECVSDVSGDVWNWFNVLNREEWLVTLAIVSVLGFMCLLGYGSRSKF